MTEDALRIHGVPDYRAAIMHKPLPIFTKPDRSADNASCSRSNRIPYPCRFTAVDGDHVEAAGRRHPVTLQIVLGGENQFALLGRRDAGGRTAMAAIGAQAHFDEYQHVALLHDQIDFTALAAKIALDQDVAALLKITAGRVFATLAGILLCRTRTEEIR